MEFLLIQEGCGFLWCWTTLAPCAFVQRNLAVADTHRIEYVEYVTACRRQWYPSGDRVLCKLHCREKGFGLLHRRV